MLNVLIDVRADEPSLERLKTMDGVNVTFIAEGNAPEELSRELPVDLIAQQHVLFCTYPPTNFDQMKGLRLVQISSAGYSQLLGLDLPGKSVIACNGAGVFDIAIAEWNIAMMVNLKRDLRDMIRNQDKGQWVREVRYEREIRDSVVGIWGYGGLARQTARLCKALGLAVHVMTRDGLKPRPNKFLEPGTGDEEGILPDRAFTPDQKTEFLSDLDFLIIAMPLNPNTEGIIGEAELQALPRHAMLLNPARGPLIQEAALLRALREKWIAGAALDTHYHYPMPEDHPLWQFPNVIMTPHISGSASTQTYLPRIWRILLENVERLMADKPMLNRLSDEQLAAT